MPDRTLIEGWNPGCRSTWGVDRNLPVVAHRLVPDGGRCSTVGSSQCIPRIIALQSTRVHGSTHLEAYLEVHGHELAAVPSLSDRELSGTAGNVGENLDRGGGQVDFGPAARYKQAEDLCGDVRVEPVDICTPTGLHKPLALKALAAGKHVLA